MEGSGTAMTDTAAYDDLTDHLARMGAHPACEDTHTVARSG